MVLSGSQLTEVTIYGMSSSSWGDGSGYGTYVAGVAGTPHPTPSTGSESWAGWADTASWPVSAPWPAMTAPEGAHGPWDPTASSEAAWWQAPWIARPQAAWPQPWDRDGSWWGASGEGWNWQSPGQAAPEQRGRVRDVEAPSWDGKATLFKEYRRRVHLYTRTTQAAPWQQGPRLLEKLSGEAWDHCETLGDPETLEHAGGVQELLAHLERRFEVVETRRVGRTLDEFMYSFTRPRGMEIQEYDSLFLKHLSRVG